MLNLQLTLMITTTMKVKTLLLLCLFTATPLLSQKLNILFLGNSYTQENQLPQLIQSVAATVGYSIQVSENTPGGCTLQQHSASPTSLNLIAAGKWDYVVLQEQSQLPSCPPAQVAQQVYPYAALLDSLIKVSNPCAQTLFYQTWGRKYGDSQNCAVYPPLCTYWGMDSLLAARYRIMAQDNEALLSPVGDVWRYLYTHHAALELYSPDQSHPSLLGSYAAACCFVTIITGADPLTITYTPTGIDPQDADVVKRAVATVVHAQLPHYFVGTYQTRAQGTWQQVTPLTIQFSNQSSYAHSYLWDFGDGNTSTDKHPTHTYAQPGDYTVTLYAERCKTIDTTSLEVKATTSALIQPQTDKALLYLSEQGNRLNLTCHTTPTHYTVINSGGAELLRHSVTSISFQVDVHPLRAGHYILLLHYANKSMESIPFVKP